jgi:hypothetical protein
MAHRTREMQGSRPKHLGLIQIVNNEAEALSLICGSSSVDTAYHALERFSSSELNQPRQLRTPPL